MDDFVDERDYKLIERDKFTFGVLKKILKTECKIILSDHEKVIVAFTGKPFPAWVWCNDDTSENDMEIAYKETTKALPLDEKYFYIMKYNLAQYFIKRAKQEGKLLSVKTNMLAYNCPDLIKPTFLSDGEFYQCGVDDIEEIVEFMDLFHKATNMDQQSLQDYRNKVEENINKGCYFFWKNGEGKTVANCNYFFTDEKIVAVGNVYTKEKYRRKHYAENLVYEVTKHVKEIGYTPMLYTDADYVASNKCYQKVGYKLIGEVCRIG